MKNKSKFSKVKILLVLIIAFLGVFFIIRETQNNNIKTKDTSVENQIEYLNNQVDSLNSVISLKNSTIEEKNETISGLESDISDLEDEISGLEDDISDLEDEIDTKDATISSQSDRIDELEEELSSEYNYQYSIDVDFYVDDVLYMSGKARNGGSLLISPTSPTKSGYTFTGWSLTNNGNVVDLSQITISSATSFYAIFEVEQPQSPTWDGTDLTGTTWRFYENLEDFPSTDSYDLNLFTDEASTTCEFYLNFISNNTNFIGMTFKDSDYYAVGIMYDLSDYYNSVLPYKGYYWSDSDYITITFDSSNAGQDATNIYFINWLQSNAELISYNPNI